MGKAILIVGATGCGKTYFTKKNLLRGVNPKAMHIYDTNNEYSEFGAGTYAAEGDFDGFIKKAYQLKKAVILIEDATAFISNRGRSDLLTKIMVAKRHSGNTVILLFHSMRAIPKYLMDISTDIFIFKTNDDEGYVEKEFKNKRLTECWKTVQDATKTNRFYSAQPPPKDTKPNMLHYSLY